jgi:hypothetical protein
MAINKVRVLLRSAYCAVKVAKAPHKQVILVISSNRYKMPKNFTEFARNKNYDGSEIKRYLLSLDSHSGGADRLEMCE